jgi:hypothetical protein
MKTDPRQEPASAPPVGSSALVRHPTLDDVPAWRMDSGIGHIVLWTKEHWTYTACGIWGSGDAVERQKPKRICSRCRATLKELRMPNTQLSGGGATEQQHETERTPRRPLE